MLTGTHLSVHEIFDNHDALAPPLTMIVHGADGTRASTFVTVRGNRAFNVVLICA